MKFTAANSGENRVTLLRATGNLQSTVGEFLVRLESTLDQVVFTVSVDHHMNTMDVVRPSGALITWTDTSTEVTEFNCGRFIVLKNPRRGCIAFVSTVREHSGQRQRARAESFCTVYVS